MLSSRPPATPAQRPPTPFWLVSYTRVMTSPGNRAPCDVPNISLSSAPRVVHEDPCAFDSPDAGTGVPHSGQLPLTLPVRL
jgi:hypothetical protein